MSASAEFGEKHRSKVSDRPTKDVCVGRFVVGVPDNMVYSYGPAYIDGWEITTIADESIEEFKSRVADRQRELKQEEEQLEGSGLMLIHSVETELTEGKIFVFAKRSIYYFENGRRIERQISSIEGLFRSGGGSYRLFSKVADLDDAKNLTQLVERLRFRKPSEFPKGPGFCFDHGFIAEPIPRKGFSESVVMFAGLETHPDVAVAFATISDIQVDRSLLQRAAENSARLASPSSYKTIFEGRRQINGMQGEESSVRVREERGVRRHSYMWESQVIKGDVSQPFLSIELSTGHGRPDKPVNASLSDEEVQLLWTQISSSIRYRSFEIVPAERLPKLPVERAKAGEPCPTAGLWTCAADTEGYEVLGGSSQYFRAGERMPQAQLFSPMTLVDKIKNHRPTFVLGTPTVWTLVKEQK